MMFRCRAEDAEAGSQLRLHHSEEKLGLKARPGFQDAGAEGRCTAEGTSCRLRGTRRGAAERWPVLGPDAPAWPTLCWAPSELVAWSTWHGAWWPAAWLGSGDTEPGPGAEPAPPTGTSRHSKWEPAPCRCHTSRLDTRCCVPRSVSPGACPQERPEPCPRPHTQSSEQEEGIWEVTGPQAAGETTEGTPWGQAGRRPHVQARCRTRSPNHIKVAAARPERKGLQRHTEQ